MVPSVATLSAASLMGDGVRSEGTVISLRGCSGPGPVLPAQGSQHRGGRRPSHHPLPPCLWGRLPGAWAPACPGGAPLTWSARHTSRSERVPILEFGVTDVFWERGSDV